MKYLELYEAFNKKKKSYYFGKREGPEYIGDYIYLTTDLGFAGSFATKSPYTVYELNLKFDEYQIFSLTEFHHKQKLAEVVDKNVMDSIMATRDVEMDWASLGNICNEEYESPEELLESLGFKGVRLRERPNIYSVLVFNMDDVLLINKIDMESPEMKEYMGKWFKEKEKEWNL